MERKYNKVEQTKVIGIKGRERKERLEELLDCPNSKALIGVLFIFVLCYVALGGAALSTIFGPKLVEAVIFFLI